MSETDLHDATAPEPEPSASTQANSQPSIEAPVEDSLEGSMPVQPGNEPESPLRFDELDPEAPLADALEQHAAVPADEDDYR